MPLTLRQSLEKRFSKEEVEEILSILLKHWEGEHSVEHLRVANHKRLLDIIGKKTMLEKIQNMYGRENALFDRVFNVWRLKTYPEWDKLNAMMKKMDENLKCPFCNHELKILRKLTGLCQPCGKVFHINEQL